MVGHDTMHIKSCFSYISWAAFVKFFFAYFFRESPESMDFLEEKEQKVPRYKKFFLPDSKFAEYWPDSVLLWCF